MAGLPPFPGFWGKWQALVGLARHGHGWWVGLLLAGSLLELVYYFGWLKRGLSPADETSRGAVRTAFSEVAGTFLFAGLAIALGLRVLAGVWGGFASPAVMLGLLGFALIFVRSLSERVKAGVAAATISWVLWELVAGSHGLPLWNLNGFFLVLALFGALVVGWPASA